jgi:glycine cleavage system transcriptional repressor
MLFVAITAVGRDRPGIVAEFSGAVFRSGGNLEDATMTRLRSEFAMLLLVAVPDETALLSLESALHLAATALGLSLGIRPLEPELAVTPETPTEGYILRLHGADRPGIVNAVTSLLAQRSLNITDLNTRVIPGRGGPVYVMMLELDIPSSELADALRPPLERLSRELGVEISLSRLDQEAL